MAQTAAPAEVILTIYETKAAGDAATHWDVFSVPWHAPTTKNGRTVLKAGSASPWPVPAKGRGVVSVRGVDRLTFRYGNIPSVRSKAIDASGLPSDLAADPGFRGGLIRLGEAAPATASDIETDFPGFGALPDETWIQLNSSGDEYVVQLKLRKQRPRDHLRDLGGGDFYVYAAETVVVHLKPEAAALVSGRPAPEAGAAPAPEGRAARVPMSAKEKALAI